MSESIPEKLRRSLTHKRTATTLIIGVLLVSTLIFFFSPFQDHATRLTHGIWHGSPPPPPPDHGPPPPPPHGPHESVDGPHDGTQPVHGNGYEEHIDIAKDPNSPFSLTRGKMPSSEARERYESQEMWRHGDTMAPADEGRVRNHKPHARFRRPARTDFTSQGEFLETQIVADYPPGDEINDIFLMLKTGSQVQWERLPVHLFTTLTRVPNFALYSDKPGSIGGIEIIDILHDLPQDLVDNDPALHRYRATKQLHQEAWGWDPKELEASGGWDIDKFKNMPMLYHAWKTDPTKNWYVFIDDDSYVFMENIVDFFKRYDPKLPYYLGSPARVWVNEEIGAIPFAHGGSVVALSWGSMNKLYGTEKTKPVSELLDQYAHEVSGSCCGDAIVAVALFKEHGIELDKLFFDDLVGIGGRFQGNTINSLVLVPGKMSVPILSWHHLLSRDIEILWEYEKLKGHGANITYSDIYQDFILPYIVEERPNWDLGANDVVYKEDEGSAVYDPNDSEKQIFPHADKLACKEACNQDSNCAAWTFMPGQCNLSTRGIVLGRAFNSYYKSSGTKKVTGWMVDRIRQWRLDEPADPLTYDKDTNTFNDDESSSEGWWIRSMVNDKFTPYFIEDSSVPGVASSNL